MFEHQRLLKAMAWSLGVAAVVGVAAVLIAYSDVVIRVTVTAVLISVLAALLWQAALRLRDSETTGHQLLPEWKRGAYAGACLFLGWNLNLALVSLDVLANGSLIRDLFRDLWDRDLRWEWVFCIMAFFAVLPVCSFLGAICSAAFHRPQRGHGRLQGMIVGAALGSLIIPFVFAVPEALYFLAHGRYAQQGWDRMLHGFDHLGVTVFTVLGLSPEQSRALSSRPTHSAGWIDVASPRRTKPGHTTPPRKAGTNCRLDQLVFASDSAASPVELFKAAKSFREAADDRPCEAALSGRRRLRTCRSPA